MDRLTHDRLTTSRCTRRAMRAAVALLTCSLAAGLTVGPTPSAHAGALAAKGDFTLAHAKPGAGQSSVVIALDGALTPARQAQLAAMGGTITQNLPFIHSVAVRLPSRSLDRLAALPFVRHVSQDGVVKRQDAFTVDSSLDNVAYQQYGLTGHGVTVAVVDSGIHTQAQDLNSPGLLSAIGGLLGGSGRVIDGFNCVADSHGYVNPNAIDDTCGHGTHVAGIVGGNGAASNGFQYFQTFTGIAPQANLVAVRVLDQNGAGTVSTALGGIQWVIQNRTKDKIRVLNLSLGHPVSDTYVNDPLCQAVEQAWKAGIVVVCAAGNDGRMNSVGAPGADNEGWGTNYGSINSPGNDPYVITVGAMKQTDGLRADDRIATYSGRGPTLGDATLKPDIVAPGNKVISLEAPNSTLAVAYGGSNQIPLSTYMHTLVGGKWPSDFYFRLSGTSMAAPVVAGAAALLFQQNPSLSPDTIKARLMASAGKLADANGVTDPCTYGAGYLDIPAALASTWTVPTGTYALSPMLVTDGQGNVFIAMDPSVYGSRALWGKSGIWGAGITDLRAVWGSGAIAGSGAPLDASRALWGRSTLSASRALWGRSALWSSSALSASRALWGRSVPGVDLSATAIQGE